jgi:UDP-N-acetylmuramoyl-tripeptide--D-alanyl-D-alanine ligase
MKLNIEQIYNIYETCQGISTDTRKIKPESMFFALKGENFNGNLFAAQALEKGAKYAIIDENISQDIYQNTANNTF